MRESNRLAVLLGAGLLLGAVAATAQAWRGDAGLEVRVSSRKGGALAGARVEMTYREGSDGSGPAFVATDAKGRAVLGGLATGTWQIEVSHPDFMSYVAVLRLSPKAKPEITASFLEATGESTTPIQVKLLKTSGGSSFPPLAAAPPKPPPVAPAAPAPQPTLPEPATPASPPAAERESPQPAAPETPAPEAAAPPPPAPEPATPKVTAPEPPTPAPPVLDEPAPKESVPEATSAQPPTAAPTMPAAPEPVEIEKPEAEPTPTPDAPPAAAPEIETPETETPETETPETPATAPAAPEPPKEPPTATPPNELPAATPAPEPDVQEPASALPAMPPPAAPELGTDTPEPSVPEPPLPEPSLPESFSPEPSLPQPSPSKQPLAEPAPVSPAPATATPKAPVTTIPAPPLPSAPAPQWRAYQERTCPECRPGEWAVTVAASVGGDGGCGEETRDAVASALATLAARPALELAGFSGGVEGAVALLEAEEAVGVQSAFGGADAEGCRILGVVLPKGSRFVGFQYEVEDGRGRRPCLPDQPCPGDTAAFAGPPRIARGASSTVIHSLARATAGDGAGLAANALMTIFFRGPNSAWTPER